MLSNDAKWAVYCCYLAKVSFANLKLSGKQFRLLLQDFEVSIEQVEKYIEFQFSDDSKTEPQP